MKRQTTTQRALAIRKTTAARKHQKGFAMEWIIIVLLVAAALVPIVIWFAHVLQGDLEKAGGAAGGGSIENVQKAVDDAGDGTHPEELEEAKKAAEGINGKINK